MIRIFVITLLVLATSAQASETWLTINVGSYHINAKKDYNQQNYGVGVEYHNDDLIFMAGEYRNSSYKDSVYAMGGWMPLKLGVVNAGATIGAVNGYPNINGGGFTLAVAGVVSAEWDKVGVNLIVLPKVKDKTPLTLGLQLKIKF